MTYESILSSVKIACRVFSNSVDDELKELIDAAFYDLEISGVANTEDEPYTAETADQLVVTAVKTYVKLHFGDLVSDNEWDRLKKSYDEQKAQLKMRRHSDAAIEPGPEPGPVPVGAYVKRDEMLTISNEDIDHYWDETSEGG